MIEMIGKLLFTNIILGSVQVLNKTDFVKFWHQKDGKFKELKIKLYWWSIKDQQLKSQSTIEYWLIIEACFCIGII